MEATCAKVLGSSEEPLSHRLNALLFLLQHSHHERFLAFEPFLKRILLNPTEDAPLRAAVALGLGQYGSADVFDALASVANDGDPQVRQCVFEALGRLNVTAAIPLLIQGLYDSHNDVFLAAAEALGQLAPESLAALIDLLNNTAEKNDVRCIAAWQLGKAQDEHALPSLLTIIQTTLTAEKPTTDAIELTALCVWALGEIGASQPIVHSILAKASTHQEPAIYDRARLALKKIARHLN
ncbi:MAG: HEAT repeat domain-containing protein [Vampirovibrionales bacterium]|nr:HEAT repeat domain-containing protein [Vampirovibrionales bacterium]